jgi:RHS repeat-associated protein
LTAAGTQAYSYDANGVPTSGGLTPGAANQVSSDGTWNYTYNLAGELVSKTLIAGGIAWAYTYDVGGELTGATLTVNGSVATSISYQYDVFGNLVGRTETDSGVVTSDVRYAVDGWDTAQPAPTGTENTNIYAVLVSNGIGGWAVSARQVFGAGFNQPLASISASGVVNWFVTDRQNSVVAVADNTGTVLASASYDAFGNVVSGGVSSVTWYGYQGGYSDPVTGLVNFGGGVGRWYAPATQQWISPDPLGFAAGQSNLSTFVANAPTNGTDPSGLFDAPWGNDPRDMIRMVLGAFGRNRSLGTPPVPQAPPVPARPPAPTPSLPAVPSVAVAAPPLPTLSLPAVPSELLAGLLSVLIGPGRRCDAFGKSASLAAGIGDPVSGGLTKKFRQAGDFDAVSYNSRAYKNGEVLGIGLSLTLAFVNPCTAAGAAGTGLRTLAWLQGVGSLANAADNLAAGNYLAAAADGVGALLGLLGFRTSCFTAETPMRTEWGAVRADEVRVGTPLLSRDEYDPEGAVGPKVVEEVFVREALIWHLQVLGQTIRSTAEHPFFVRDKGWTPLNQIHAGDSIWTEVSGWVTVDVVEDTGAWETVYNFRIADSHTYFVGETEWGFSVWAHNACQINDKKYRDGYDAIFGTTSNGLKAGVPGPGFTPKAGITTRYVRPSGAGPTAAQTRAVQGQPCVDCGRVTTQQVADHIDPQGPRILNY